MTEGLRALLAGRVVPMYTTLARAFDGDRDMAIFVAQVAFWAERDADASGWVQISDAQIEDETTISPKISARLRALGAKHNVLHTERRGQPPRLRYRIDWDALNQFLPSGRTRYAQRAPLQTPAGRIPLNEMLGEAPSWLVELRQVLGYSLTPAQEVTLTDHLAVDGVPESVRLQTALDLQEKWPGIRRTPSRPRGRVDLGRTMRNWCIPKGRRGNRGKHEGVLGNIQDGSGTGPRRKLVTTRTIE